MGFDLRPAKSEHIFIYVTWPHIPFVVFTNAFALFHADDEKTPYYQVKESKGDLSRLRTFGCRVWVRNPGRRGHKMDNHVNRGVFFGYTSSLRNI